MGKYLNELYKKPDHHKKRFALLSSLTITLFIFGIWSLATFGISDTKIVANANVNEEVGPFQSLRMNLASSFDALKSSFGELKTGVEAIDLEAEYTDMRDEALETYGE